MNCTEKEKGVVKVLVMEKGESGEDQSLIPKSAVDVTKKPHDKEGSTTSSKEVFVKEKEYKAKDASAIGYSAIDPMELPSVSRRHYTKTFFLVLLAYTSPVLILGLTLKIFDLKNTIEHPEGWLNCALWYAFVWSPFTQAFVWFVMLRVIKKNSGYSDWRPPVWKFPLHCAVVGGLIIAFWTAL